MPHEFEDTRDFLNRKPNIEFVEPEAVDEDTVANKTEQPTSPLQESRDKVSTLINQYKRIEDLADIAQTRVDDRAKDLEVCLDPVADVQVIDSLKRAFGSSELCITYDQYKQCLDKISRTGQEKAPKISLDDVAKAKTDLFRKNLGGFGAPDGTLRPDLTTPNPIEPVNMEAFQNDALKKLFEMLLPMLNDFTAKKIREVLDKLGL